MDADYERLYSDVEEWHPWFVARRELFTRLAGEDRSSRILDVGCGTGIFLQGLRKAGFQNLAGVEPSAQLRSQARDPNLEILPELPDRTYDKIFVLDVLEHIADDRGFLVDILRVLEPGGLLFISVPAHPFLWSEHDDVNHHHRRYRRRELKDKLSEAGFDLLRLSYWNMVSFLPIYLIRSFGRERKSSDLQLGSSPVLSVYGLVLRLENWLLRLVSLPMGVSLIAVARKGKRSLSAGERAELPEPH